MRPGAAALSVATMVAGFAGVAELRPFAAYVHGYLVDVPIAIASAFLLTVAISGLFAAPAAVRFAALGAFGGAVLGGGLLFADIVAGPPVRIPAAPGQAFTAPHMPFVDVNFPGLPAADLNLAHWPDSVEVRDGGRSVSLGRNGIVRANVFAFTNVNWPIARIRARDAAGRPVTTTQPNGASFLSQYLTFPDVDTDGRAVDFFSVPPLHRDVGVKYFQGLPERGIDVPFLALEIRETNGAKLYDGVAVDGRTLVKAGVVLTFALGTYPSVIMTGAAPLWLFGASLTLVVAGVVGYAVSVWRTSDSGANS